MAFSRFHRALSALAVALFSVSAYAYETDQFTVPAHPLEDLGVALNSKLRAVINNSAQELNFRKSDLSDDEFHAELAQAIQKELGVGLPETTVERWAIEFKSQDLVFHYPPKVWDSV